MTQPQTQPEVNPGLQLGADYINQGRLAGASDAQIEIEFLKAGWQATDMQLAFQLANKDLASKVSTRSSDGKPWLWWLFGIIVLCGIAAIVGTIVYFQG